MTFETSACSIGSNQIASEIMEFEMIIRNSIFVNEVAKKSALVILKLSAILVEDSKGQIR